MQISSRFTIAIHMLDDKLLQIQEAMERELKSITLADVNSDLRKYLEKVI